MLQRHGHFSRSRWAAAAQDGRFILRSSDDDDAGVQADSSSMVLPSIQNVRTAPLATIFTSPLLGVSGVSNQKMIRLIF